MLLSFNSLIISCQRAVAPVDISWQSVIVAFIPATGAPSNHIAEAFVIVFAFI
jgi:hypothetical protein